MGVNFRMVSAVLFYEDDYRQSANTSRLVVDCIRQHLQCDMPQYLEKLKTKNYVR